MSALTGSCGLLTGSTGPFCASVLKVSGPAVSSFVVVIAAFLSHIMGGGGMAPLPRGGPGGGPGGGPCGGPAGGPAPGGPAPGGGGGGGGGIIACWAICCCSCS
ncbi:MAG: hypothetical protein EOQ99_16615 [Mesorhizobium sp.]|nr:MAG: hypothetical protein EOQ99_16615 [Mesorhizobium sp.]